MSGGADGKQSVQQGSEAGSRRHFAYPPSDSSLSGSDDPDGAPPEGHPSIEDLIRLQNEQSQKHMEKQFAESMNQAERTHVTSVMAEIAKGSDKRAEMVADIASHHHDAANKAADKVAGNVS